MDVTLGWALGLGPKLTKCNLGIIPPPGCDFRGGPWGLGPDEQSAIQGSSVLLIPLMDVTLGWALGPGRKLTKCNLGITRWEHDASEHGAARVSRCCSRRPP
eukprot:3931169-Karenia_brevis.AAC.1